MLESVNYRSYGFPPSVADLVEAAATHDFFIHGQTQRISIDAPATGSGELEAKSTLLDRFQVKWKSGQSTLSWWVIFDASLPELPPDFIFADDFLPSMDDLPALVDWDARDRFALVKVLSQLMRAHGHTGLRKLSERLRKSYHDIVSEPQVSGDHCSVCLDVGANDVAQFFIRFHFDQDPLLYADLQFTQGPSGNASTSVPRVRLSESLDAIVGPVTCNREALLQTCAKSTYDKISSAMDNEKNSIGIRRELMSRILTLQGDSLLEADIERFRALSFLVEEDGVFVQVDIDIPAGFPHANNTVTITATDIYERQQHHHHRRHQLPTETVHFGSVGTETLDLVTQKVIDSVWGLVARTAEAYQKNGIEQH